MEHDVSEHVQWLARQYGVPAVDLRRLKFEEAALRLVPASVALKHGCIPFALQGDCLLVAFADPSNVWAQDEIGELSGLKIEPVVADEQQLRSEILLRYGFA